MRRAVPVVLLVLVLAGCGGGEEGPKTFEGDGYSFQVPSDWEETTAELVAQTGDVKERHVFALDEFNLVAVTVYEVGVAITAENIGEFEGEIVSVFTQLTEQAKGEVESGPTKVEVDGLPGFQFSGTASTPDGPLAQDRATLIFDGTTEYFVYCQWTDENADEVGEGCDQVLDTFDAE